MNFREKIAEGAVIEYHRLKREPLESLEESMTDLMTDLLHLAERENLNGEAILRMAQIHFEAEHEASEKTDNLLVARTIISQMGGGKRLKAMIKARNFAGGDNYVTFHFSGSKIDNRIRVTLDASDTYTVQIFKLRGHVLSKVVEHDMIYFDQLVDLFMSTTKLAI
jgi:hypothetical protein